MRDLNLDEILLVEPDDGIARALATSLRAAAPSSRVLRVAGAEGLATTSLRRCSLILCADEPPEHDACEIIPAVHDRRRSLPVIVLRNDAPTARIHSLYLAGAADCAPRSELSTRALRFVLEKSLCVAMMERDALRTNAGLMRSLAALIQRNRTLTETAERLEMMASTDPLTNLNNRWWLKQRLDTMFAVTMRYGSDLACMMIDLDNFKLVNDTFGHAEGDRVLALTGELIRREIRASDIAARYGGDEFVILMPRTSAPTALNLATRLQRRFEPDVRKAAGIDPACAMCIGVACVSISRPGAAEVLIRHADTALYAAKRAGVGDIRICGPDGETALDIHSFAA